MSEIVIKVDDLSKQYHLGVINHGTLSRNLQSRWARFRGKEDPNSQVDIYKNESVEDLSESFWALKNISFEVKRGEILGVIGRNGAGKSTLLKILSRITTPTNGNIKVKGRIASLLEVGTGFHPELTGRENVYLNGAILGMTKHEVASKFDDIVKFAEVEKFIDTPVKRYSSGMYVRLAFAVAAHLEPEILIVDEVLAVGDAIFQKKCLGKMGEIANNGRTVLFVSHNINAIKRLCTRVIFLENGKIVFQGDTHEGISKYINENRIETTSLSGEYLNSIMTGIINERNPTVRFKKITISDVNGNERSTFRSDEEIKITMTYNCFTSVDNLRLLITVNDIHGNNIMNTLNYDDESELLNLPRRPGLYETTCILQKNLFGEERFVLIFGLINGDIEHVTIQKGLFFDILFYPYSNCNEKLFEKISIRSLMKWKTKNIENFT